MQGHLTGYPKVFSQVYKGQPLIVTVLSKMTAICESLQNVDFRTTFTKDAIKIESDYLKASLHVIESANGFNFIVHVDDPNGVGVLEFEPYAELEDLKWIENESDLLEIVSRLNLISDVLFYNIPSVQKKIDETPVVDKKKVNLETLDETTVESGKKGWKKLDASVGDPININARYLKESPRLSKPKSIVKMEAGESLVSFLANFDRVDQALELSDRVQVLDNFKCDECYIKPGMSGKVIEHSGANVSVEFDGIPFPVLINVKYLDVDQQV